LHILQLLLKFGVLFNNFLEFAYFFVEFIVRHLQLLSFVLPLMHTLQSQQLLLQFIVSEHQFHNFIVFALNLRFVKFAITFQLIDFAAQPMFDFLNFLRNLFPQFLVVLFPFLCEFAESLLVQSVESHPQLPILLSQPIDGCGVVLQTFPANLKLGQHRLILLQKLLVFCFE
jgi:hypothetical protein